MTINSFKKVMNFLYNKFRKIEEQVFINEISMGLSRKNLLKNTAVSKETYGIKFIVNDDGSVTVSGTAQETATLILSTSLPNMLSGNYYLSGCSGGSPMTYFLRYYNITDNKIIDNYNNDTLINFNASGSYNFAIVVLKNQSINQTIYPMLRPIEIIDNTYEPYIDNLKTQIESKVPIQRGIVHPTGNGSTIPAGWCKVAETTITAATVDREIILDVSDGYGVHQTSAVYGRLFVHVRVLNGAVYKSGCVVEWLYSNKNINFEQFVLAYKTENGIHNIQLWTNVQQTYVHRFFQTAMAKGFADFGNYWTLLETYGNNTGQLPEGYETIVSTPGWQQQQLDQLMGTNRPSLIRTSTDASGQCAFVFASSTSSNKVRAGMHFIGIGNNSEYFELSIFYNIRSSTDSRFPAVINTQCMHGDVGCKLIKTGDNSFAVVFELSTYSVITCITTFAINNTQAYCLDGSHEMPTGEEVQLTEIGNGISK